MHFRSWLDQSALLPRLYSHPQLLSFAFSASILYLLSSQELFRLYLAEPGLIHIPSLPDPHPLVEAAAFLHLRLALCTDSDTFVSRLCPSVNHVTMGSLTETILDSVQQLSLNGAANQANGDKITIRNICCVGAGYVGM